MAAYCFHLLRIGPASSLRNALEAESLRTWMVVAGRGGHRVTYLCLHLGFLTSPILFIIGHERSHHEYDQSQRWHRDLLQGLGFRPPRSFFPRLAAERR